MLPKKHGRNVADATEILGTIGVSPKENQNPCSSPSMVGAPADDTDPPIPATLAPETTIVPTAYNAYLAKIYLCLYFDEQANPEEPLGVVTLRDSGTREAFFTIIQEDLEDELKLGDIIDFVNIKRADGKVFKELNVRTMPIKQAGQKDMWDPLVQDTLAHGAGDGGLRGYVKVKKLIDAR